MNPNLFPEFISGINFTPFVQVNLATSLFIA